MDEGYFTVEFTELEQQKGIRGRGAVGKRNVASLIAYSFQEKKPVIKFETIKSNQLALFC